MAILFSGISIAQEAQKNFINYQGVARNGADQLMANETMTIGIALKMGSATGASTYAENHSVTTDANGVFSLKIGSGDTVSGDYVAIPWGSGATFVTVLVNGTEIGTTEMMAVPYALSSGDGSQSASEVPYNNSVSGLVATNAQEAIDELVGSGAVDADADPTNELQDISLTGTDLTISEGSTIDLSAIVPPGGTDDQNAAEVPFDNSTTALAATDTQAAIEELAAGGLVDTDDQNLTFNNATNILEIEDGNTVDLSSLSGGGGASLWSADTNGINYSSGSIGIGSNSNGFFPLSVSTASESPLYLNSSGADNYITFDNSNGYIGYAGVWTGDNDMDFGTGLGNGSGKVHLTTNATPRLTVAANGDVGIGNRNPSTELDVTGVIKATSLEGTGTRNVVVNDNGILSASEPIIFRVEGDGYAVKNMDGGTSIETDIWENIWYDTANAFNETTKRFVAPEAGFYFLHATIVQANGVSDAFYVVKFNLNNSWLDGTSVDGDTVKAEISGIFRLREGQEVYVQLRNYSVGQDSRIDGFGSFFEGYKIN